MSHRMKLFPLKGKSLLSKSLSPLLSEALNARFGSTYPIDDTLFGLTDDQKQLRETTFSFCQKELAPLAGEIDRNNEFKQMRQFWRKLGEMGFLGITISPEYGGSEGGYLEQTIFLEEIARASAAIGLSVGAHMNLCMGQIYRNGTGAQKLKYLPKLCSGESIGALAMSEANAGSDVLSMQTKAILNGDHYILNGSKFWITNGPDADIVVVYARTDSNASNPGYGITAFIVETDQPGFKTGQKLDKLGLRGSNTSELIFEDLKVPVENVLGKVNKGISVLFSGLNFERVILAGGPVGVMQASMDVAFDYVHTRKQFNTRIGEFQLMQGKLADMYTTTSVCRSYLYSVTQAVDKGRSSSKDCAGVLLFCAERATKVALDSIQCLGGNGYINEYPTGRFLRDAKLFEIGGGTSEIRRMLIGRAINSEYT